MIGLAFSFVFALCMPQIYSAPVGTIFRETGDLNAALYFASNTPNLDELDFFGDMAVNPPAALGYHRKYSIIYSGERYPNCPANKVRHITDCEYKIELAQVKQIENSMYLDFEFRMNQFSCGHNVSIEGGSAFDAFAINGIQLISCNVVDHLNYRYSVHCHLPLVCSSISLNQTCIQHGNVACLNMTLILAHEHYDAVSETLGQMRKSMQIAIRNVLVDNKQYCGRVKVNITDSISISKISAENYLLAPNQEWYSGIWMNRIHIEVANISRNSSLITSLSKNLQGRVININSLPVNPTIESFEMSDAVKSSLDYSLQPFMVPIHSYYQSQNNRLKDYSKFTIQPCFAALPNVTLANAIPVTSRYGAGETLPELSEFVPTYTTTHGTMYASLLTLTEMKQLVNTEMKYHMFGSSHMRYAFDITAAHLIGMETVHREYKNHANWVIKNFHYYDSRYAREYPELLHHLCGQIRDHTLIEGENRMYNHTIIVQIGAWDLAYGPLRVFLKSKNLGGWQLIKIMQQLFNGSLECPGVKRVVLVTPMPYPICYNDDYAICELNRGYRTNSAINAVRTYLLDNLLAASKDSAIQLVVVDATKIIQPRLLFTEDTEASCINHYSCRESENVPIIVFGKGGYAYWVQLMRALLNYK